MSKNQSKSLVGKLVQHKKSGNLGLVVKENEIHKQFLKVMTMGKIEEWHRVSIMSQKFKGE